MARRKGISSNTIKSKGVMTLGVQQPRDPSSLRDVDMPENPNENMKPNSVIVESSVEVQSMNNNRYLHKKFKKMATVLHVDNDLNKDSEERKTPSTGASDESTEMIRRDSTPLPLEINSEHKFETSPVPNLATGSMVTDSDRFQSVSWTSGKEHNVQSNIKEYSHSHSLTDEKSELLNNDSVMISRTIDNNAVETQVYDNSKDLTNSTGSGKHVCPYCKLSCAKPSVLLKHIRAHTNERPYPCIPCGFAFKTKSNLYKHCRSRSHALRLQGSEETPNVEEDWSLGSEADVVNSSYNKSETSWQSERLCQQNDSTENIHESDSLSSPNHINSNSEFRTKTIYKPKFHKATLYVEDEDSQRSGMSPNSEFLKQHISKIILENEAIVDYRDSLLQRKYMKDSSNHKVSNDSTSQEIVKNDQPLNLTKSCESSESNYRKRCYSESFAQPDALLSNKASQHPLNPEGSIIKDLLLKARAQACGLLPVTSDTYDGSETLYTCASCKISFRSVDNLEIHTLYYCKNNTPSASLLNGTLHNSNDVLKKADGSNFVRSNSIDVTLPETYNPNTLAKLASSSLKAPTPLRSNKPHNLVLHKIDTSDNNPLPSPGPLLGNTRLVDSHRNTEHNKTPNILLAESNRLQSSPLRTKDDINSNEYNSLPKITEENIQDTETFHIKSKGKNVETPATLRFLEELSLSPIIQNSTSLQMFGGEVKILDNSGGTTTMRIEPLTSQQSSTLISQSRASPKAQGPESIVVRSGLHSGGTIVHNPPTPKEPLPSPHPQTPRLLVSIAPNISTPNLTVSGIPAPNMSKFQFPPIGFNSLQSLPPISTPSPSGITTILHGGKLIPFVPGMPGPNSLSPFLPMHSKLSPSIIKSIETLNNISESQCHTTTEEPAKVNNVESGYLHSSKGLNHISPQNEKKDVNKKINNSINHSVTTPLAKITIPTIKIVSDIPSPSNLKTVKNDFIKSMLPQHKIDELLKKNVEILQKNDVTRETKQPYNNKHKPHTSNKPTDKVPITLETNHKDSKFTKPTAKSVNNEPNEFNFENLISKTEILIKSTESNKSEESVSKGVYKSDENSKSSERSETSYFKKNLNPSISLNKLGNQKPKFLRPTSLPLKPGTFTPKRHHGITPNANTLPLISPDTPRPAKAYGQLYLNGHAYTYLGLKCSTKVYYCTLNRPQPTYVPNQHSLSMYSNWQVCSEATPHPLGLTPGKAMVLYDSRHRPQNFAVAKIKQDHLMTHSSQWSVAVPKQPDPPTSSNGSDQNEQSNNKTSNADTSNNVKSIKNLSGGFESNEEYTYVRGRGRGRYVCSECGIRCKKPSMLKKHIRTHTDVRPFTCKHCAFSFKTKGNLTKHMKSKSHFKKCIELGINPSEGSEIGEEEGNQGMGATGESDDESDSEDDANDGETESSDTDSWKSRLEHEAAHCLLSLWGGRPAPGLLSSARPTTYPYTPNNSESYTHNVSSQQTFTKDHNQVINKKQTTQINAFKQDSANKNVSHQQTYYPIDLSKPMDLSRGEESKTPQSSKVPAEYILTPVGEPDLLASLVQSSAKLPHYTKDWHEDEPMLQAYLTEKALQDSKMKQSQYKNAQLKQIEYGNNINDYSQSNEIKDSSHNNFGISSKSSSSTNKDKSSLIQNNNSMFENRPAVSEIKERSKSPDVEKNHSVLETSGTENAKFVASEYLKAVCGKTNEMAEPSNRHEKLTVESVSNSEETSGAEKEIDIQKVSQDHVSVVRKVVVEAGGTGFKLTPSNEYSGITQFGKGHLSEDGRSVCTVCNKSFSKPSQLRLHINIHYMERPFRCSACAVSFRTRGHLQKHERSGSHHNKVSMTSTFGTATTTNPRPFKCSDCKIAFRIHGHLAKHLRSKMHVMRLECLGKLPFGTFAEIERAGVSLTDIDTTDCDNSLTSLQLLAQKLHERDPTKLEKWDPVTMAPPLLPPGSDFSDDDEPTSPQVMSPTRIDETHCDIHQAT